MGLGLGGLVERLAVKLPPPAIMRISALVSCAWSRLDNEEDDRIDSRHFSIAMILAASGVVQVEDGICGLEVLATTGEKDEILIYLNSVCIMKHGLEHSMETNRLVNCTFDRWCDGAFPPKSPGSWIMLSTQDG